MAQLKLNTKQKPEGQAWELLSRLSAYAKEHGLSKKELSQQLDVPYGTLQKWWFFTQGTSARKPSEAHLARVEEFLLSKERPEVYAKIQEAGHRAEKIKYILLLLEDELKWFRDGGPKERDEFRKELNSSDIGYISSLLTMLTEEGKFNRWLVLTTARFNSFKRR